MRNKTRDALISFAIGAAIGIIIAVIGIHSNTRTHYGQFNIPRQQVTTCR